MYNSPKDIYSLKRSLQNILRVFLLSDNDISQKYFMEKSVTIFVSFNPSLPNPGQRQKIKLIFIFTLLCGTSRVL